MEQKFGIRRVAYEGYMLTKAQREYLKEHCDKLYPDIFPESFFYCFESFDVGEIVKKVIQTYVESHILPASFTVANGTDSEKMYYKGLIDQLKSKNISLYGVNILMPCAN